MNGNPYHLNTDDLALITAFAKRLGFGTKSKQTVEKHRALPEATLTLQQHGTIRTDAAAAGEFLKWAMQVADAIEEHGYEWDVTDRYAIDSYDADGCAHLGRNRFITVILQAPRHWGGHE